MDGFIAGLISSFWLGVLTSISPCPLATNIAAISFISKKINHPRIVLITGIAYTVGRMCAYALLGFIIINSLLSIPFMAQGLQKYMSKILGPLLIIIGVFLLDVVKFNMPGFVLPEKYQQKLAGSGIGGAFVLGFIFALAFCPISAALFFGSLIPIAVRQTGGLILPFVYGIGTGLPVLGFACAIAYGITSLSQWFRHLTKIEYYMRKITGIIFILIGFYYILKLMY